MKTAAAFLALLAGSASAFAPISKPAVNTALGVSAELEGMVGVDIETGNKIVSAYSSLTWQLNEEVNLYSHPLYFEQSCPIYFQYDPLNLSDYVPPKWARAAELANGRSAMLATVGYVFPKWFGHFEGPVSVDDPIAAIGQADPQWWAQFIIFCATIEGYKYRQGLEGKSSTGGGEPAIDWMKMYPEDEEGRRKMELKELKNGRLAMLGIAGFVSAHYIPSALPIGPGF